MNSQGRMRRSEREDPRNRPRRRRDGQQGEGLLLGKALPCLGNTEEARVA